MPRPVPPGFGAELFLEGRRTIAVASYTFTALLAMLSHEAGILPLPLTILIACAMKKPFTRPTLALYGASTAASAIYFGIRHLIGTSAQYRQPATVAPFGIFFFKYLGLLLLPVHMSIERSTNTPQDKLSIQALVAWVGVLGIMTVVIVMRSKWPMMAAALAWTSIALLPFCGLVPIYQGMAERFLYFASMGIAFMVAALCCRIPAQVRSFALIVVGIWVLWGAWRVHRRLIDWSDPIQLYQSSLEASPGSTKLLYNLGAVSEQRGDLSRAELSYRSVLDLQPNFDQAIAGLANIRLRTNAPKEAAKLYQRALSVKPDDPGVVTNYAASLQELGDLVDAAAQYKRAIALAPKTDDAYCGLGAVLFQTGDVLGATIQFIKATRMNPLDPIPYYDLGSVYENVGRLDAAAEYYKKTLELNPNDSDATVALLRVERISTLQLGR